MKKRRSSILRDKKIVSAFIEDYDPDWYEKAVAKRKAEIEAEEKIEEDRIKEIKCPSCKSANKNHIVKRNDNGIFGPGYSSWVVDEYYVCRECGTMFKDLNKK